MMKNTHSNSSSIPDTLIERIRLALGDVAHADQEELVRELEEHVRLLVRSAPADQKRI